MCETWAYPDWFSEQGGPGSQRCTLHTASRHAAGRRGVRTLKEQLVHNKLVLRDLVQRGSLARVCRLRGSGRRRRLRRRLGLHSLLLLLADLHPQQRLVSMLTQDPWRGILIPLAFKIPATQSESEAHDYDDSC